MLIWRFNHVTLGYLGPTYLHQPIFSHWKDWYYGFFFLSFLLVWHSGAAVTA